MVIITPPAVVLVASLFSPRILLSSTPIFDVEFVLPEPLCDAAPHWIEDGAAYWAYSIRQPQITHNGSPCASATEVGPGSVIRLKLTQEDSRLVIKAVSVIEHKVYDAFAGKRMAFSSQ